MKKIIGVALLFSSKLVLGCDFCGCFMGITPYDNQSSITLMYRYKSFNGYGYSGERNALFPQYLKTKPYNTSNSSIIDNSQKPALKHGNGQNPQGTSVRTQKDYEVYTTTELRGKYFVHKRVELNGIVPLVINSSYTNNELRQAKAMSDITLFTGYHLVSRVLTEKYQHRLIMGVGIKLPTGNCNLKDNNEQRVDFLLQGGTGSTDYMTYLNYILGVKNFGININSTYKINGVNHYNERICNSSTNYFNLFYKLRQNKNLKLIPSLQGYLEYTRGVYINDVYQFGTEVYIATAGAGLDVFYKNFSLSAYMHLPIYEKKASYNLQTAGKLMVSLTYNFGQKKYLIKSLQKS